MTVETAVFAGLTPAHLTNPAVLLGLLVVLIIFGGLVPRWLYRSMMQIKDQIIADQRSMIGEQSRQITRLIGGAEVAVRVSEALQDNVAPDVDGGDA